MRYTLDVILDDEDAAADTLIRILENQIKTVPHDIQLTQPDMVCVRDIKLAGEVFGTSRIYEVHH